MTNELRRDFHDRMAHVHRTLGTIAGEVADSLVGVTRYLLGETADAPVVDDSRVDATYAWLEEETFDLVALQAPVGRDLRFLTASLRIGQEIERTGDLVASIGSRAGQLQPFVSSGPLNQLVAEIGEGAAAMLRGAGAAYAVLDEAMAKEIAAQDDAIDELHRQLLRALFGLDDMPVEPAVELGLVARFYERIADHAVVISERVRFIASSQMNPGDSDESEISLA
jgi:phosphate transport system protein